MIFEVSFAQLQSRHTFTPWHTYLGVTPKIAKQQLFLALTSHLLSAALLYNALFVSTSALKK